MFIMAENLTAESNGSLANNSVISEEYNEHRQPPLAHSCLSQVQQLSLEFQPKDLTIVLRTHRTTRWPAPRSQETSRAGLWPPQQRPDHLAQARSFNFRARNRKGIQDRNIQFFGHELGLCCFSAVPISTHR
jgi:hypothetical protein